jgi:hypothetical protein
MNNRKTLVALSNNLEVNRVIVNLDFKSRVIIELISTFSEWDTSSLKSYTI